LDLAVSSFVAKFVFDGLTDPDQDGFNSAILIKITKCHRAAADRQMRDHEAELKELRHRIQGAIQSGFPDIAQPAMPASAKTHSSLTELESVLRDFGVQLSEAVEEAEDTIASHPLSSVGAAFLLGLAIGRLTRRNTP
jgi:ElaB/YqjD/DUF883 family membrane-anchored ribosome-binding protein